MTTRVESRQGRPRFFGDRDGSRPDITARCPVKCRPPASAGAAAPRRRPRGRRAELHDDGPCRFGGTHDNRLALVLELGHGSSCMSAPRGVSFHVARVEHSPCSSLATVVQPDRRVCVHAVPPPRGTGTGVPAIDTAFSIRLERRQCRELLQHGRASAPPAFQTSEPARLDVVRGREVACSRAPSAAPRCLLRRLFDRPDLTAVGAGREQRQRFRASVDCAFHSLLVSWTAQSFRSSLSSMPMKG